MMGAEKSKSVEKRENEMEETKAMPSEIRPGLIGLFIVGCAGFYHGPFQSADAAAAWADHQLPFGAWTIAMVKQPS